MEVPSDNRQIHTHSDDPLMFHLQGRETTALCIKVAQEPADLSLVPGTQVIIGES